MGKDLFNNVPLHVTGLFIFLCVCQVLLMLHLSRNNFKSPQALLRGSNTIPINPISGESQQLEAARPGPLNGKLRLLWSMKSGGGRSSNEGRDQNLGPIYQDSLAEKETSIRQLEEHPSIDASQAYKQDVYAGNNEVHGMFLKDYTFRFIINQPYACRGPDGGNEEETDEGEDSPSPPFMLLLVHSHPSHKAQRDAIRDTWGTVRKDYESKHPVRIVFILGVSDFDADLRVPLKESKMYQDIVLGNFTDTYHNLTLKSLFGLQWALQFCPEARYVMKTDDDVYFNVPNLIQFLSGLVETIPMLGSLNVNSPVQRHGLWRVSDTQFPHKTYPPYCSGCAYVLSHNILSTLLAVASQVPLLPIEDVYVTGLLGNATQTQCQNAHVFPQWYMGPSPKHICLLLNNRIFGLHNVPYEKMYYVHRKVMSRHECRTT